MSCLHQNLHAIPCPFHALSAPPLPRKRIPQCGAEPRGQTAARPLPRATGSVTPRKVRPCFWCEVWRGLGVFNHRFGPKGRPGRAGLMWASVWRDCPLRNRIFGSTHVDPPCPSVQVEPACAQEHAAREIRHLRCCAQSHWLLCERQLGVHVYFGRAPGPMGRLW